MKVKMISDKLLVRQHEGAKEKAGLILADKYIDNPKVGTVVAVGEGWWTEKGDFIPTVCKVGDVVVFQPYANNTVEVNGETVLIMREIDVHFIL